MISHQNWKRNWGKNREEKLSFFSQNFDSREENLFAKSHSIEKRKRNFLQNLEFREENENFVFKILTIEIISRNDHSILQLEIKKMDHFLSRWRISSMPVIHWHYIYILQTKFRPQNELVYKIWQICIPRCLCESVSNCYKYHPNFPKLEYVGWRKSKSLKLRGFQSL